LFVCACIIALAVFLRFFVISVWSFEGKRIFVCELAACMEKSWKGDLLLTDRHLLLWQKGKSGETIEVPTPFDTLALSIPGKGDTLFFDSLSPMLWDMAVSLYRENFPEKEAKIYISLWSTENEVPFAYVGRASISGRPVSEREVPFLPWHELRLLELQLRKIFPAIDSIHFKRKLFADSLEIEKFAVEDELFYLSCVENGLLKQCYDSREKGFFRKSSIRGIKFATFPLWL